MEKFLRFCKYDLPFIELKQIFKPLGFFPRPRSQMIETTSFAPGDLREFSAGPTCLTREPDFSEEISNQSHFAL
jgi:hypothetical protein